MNAEELKKGDVIFIVDDNEENISSLSYGYGDLSYYHCGIYIGDGKLIEAVPYHGVIEDDVSKYSSKKILVARVDLTVEDIQKVIDTAKNFLGLHCRLLSIPVSNIFIFQSSKPHVIKLL